MPVALGPVGSKPPVPAFSPWQKHADKMYNAGLRQGMRIGKQVATVELKEKLDLLKLCYQTNMATMKDQLRTSKKNEKQAALAAKRKAPSKGALEGSAAADEGHEGYEGHEASAAAYGWLILGGSAFAWSR